MPEMTPEINRVRKEALRTELGEIEKRIENLKKAAADYEALPTGQAIDELGSLNDRADKLREEIARLTGLGE